MNNRYTTSLLAAAFATTLLHAQNPVQLQNTIIINTNIPQQAPQRATNGNSSRQPSTLLLNTAVLSNVLVVQTQSGGPNGPNGTVRTTTPQRQAAPVRVVSRPNTGNPPPQRRPTNPAPPQRASTPAQPQRAANPAPQRQVVLGGPNVSGVIAQPIQFRGGPNGPNGLGNPIPININVNPILSNSIPVQAIVNDNNEPINVSRGNQNFVFELNNDNNRGNINVNVEMPQLQVQAPQINLPQVNKVELPEINMPKVTLPKIKTSGSGGSGGGKLKKSPQFSFKSSWKSFKRDFRHKWRKLSRKRSKIRYRVAECFFSGC